MQHTARRDPLRLTPGLLCQHLWHLVVDTDARIKTCNTLVTAHFKQLVQKDHMNLKPDTQARTGGRDIRRRMSRARAMTTVSNTMQCATSQNCSSMKPMVATHHRPPSPTPALLQILLRHTRTQDVPILLCKAQILLHNKGGRKLNKVASVLVKQGLRKPNRGTPNKRGTKQTNIKQKTNEERDINGDPKTKAPAKPRTRNPTETTNRALNVAKSVWSPFKTGTNCGVGTRFEKKHT